MRDKPEWLNKGDVGYLINDNHVDGPFCTHVIYPNSNFKGTYCLVDRPLTREETMVDIIPDVDDNNINEEYGYESLTFEEIYDNKYSEINGIFYINITSYNDVVLYNSKSKYIPYKDWFCKDKKSAQSLWKIIKNKHVRELNKLFSTFK